MIERILKEYQNMVRKKQFKINCVLLLSCLCMALSNCDLGDIDMQKQIAKYKGDGIIKYLKKPAILGRSGVLVDFPALDLSSNFKIQYNITGLPDGNDYILYLIPNGPVDETIFKRGFCSYKILRNKQIISENSSKVEALQKEIGAGETKYYFYTKGEGPDYIDIEAKDDELLLVISYENESSLNGVKAIFRISKGAFK